MDINSEFWKNTVFFLDIIFKIVIMIMAVYGGSSLIRHFKKSNKHEIALDLIFRLKDYYAATLVNRILLHRNIKDFTIKELDDLHIRAYNDVGKIRKELESGNLILKEKYIDNLIELISKVSTHFAQLPLDFKNGTESKIDHDLLDNSYKNIQEVITKLKKYLL